MPAGAIGETGDAAGEAQIQRAFQVIGHFDSGIGSATQYGRAALPTISRATRVFMICAVPSPI
jgi:hypothetical protein